MLTKGAEAMRRWRERHPGLAARMQRERRARGGEALKERERQYAAVRAAVNPGQAAEYMRQKRLREPGRSASDARKRRNANRVQAREESRQYRIAHPEYFAAAAAERRAAVLKRTPAWADRVAIRGLYAQAKSLSEATGIKHSVDHEIPLCGRNVSGLHVEANLRVILLLDNQKKSSRFTADEFGG